MWSSARPDFVLVNAGHVTVRHYPAHLSCLQWERSFRLGLFDLGPAKNNDIQPWSLWHRVKLSPKIVSLLNQSVQPLVDHVWLMKVMMKTCLIEVTWQTFVKARWAWDSHEEACESFSQCYTPDFVHFWFFLPFIHLCSFPLVSPSAQSSVLTHVHVSAN